MEVSVSQPPRKSAACYPQLLRGLPKHSINATKKFWKGEDKDTLRLKDWFRAICRKAGYNCETERFFTINYHDTNELAADKEIPYPVDIYISHRRKPDYQKIVEIDGEYHDEPEQTCLTAR